MTVGQAFQAVTVRATDSSVPANPVLGAAVSIQQTMFLPSNEEALENKGDASSSHNAMKVILGASQQTIVSDANGLVVFTPYNATLYRPMEIVASAAAGTIASLQFGFQQLPLLSPGTGASTGKARAPVGMSRAVHTTHIRPNTAATLLSSEAVPLDASSFAVPSNGAPGPQQLRNPVLFELELDPCQDNDSSREVCDAKTATSWSTDPPSR